jgi:hypothetical protein
VEHQYPVLQVQRSKDQFLRYAGRYIRRPPIAQRRVTFVGGQIVRFWYRDKKLRRRVDVQCSPEESWNAGVSTFQSGIGTPSGALAYSPHAPCRRPSTLSSPSWDRSEGHVPSLAAGQN